jgi:superfamily I DNA/RNA helicase
VRLVRGFAGSGKSLVLRQRARYLTGLYPEWQILVLTYNEKPARKLETQFIGYPNIKATHFHRLCIQIMQEFRDHPVIDSPKGWVEHNKDQWPLVQEMGSDFVSAEISWILEMGFTSQAEYLAANRRNSRTACSG